MSNQQIQNSKNKLGNWTLRTVVLINIILLVPVLLIILMSLLVPSSPGDVGLAIIVSALYIFIYTPLALFNSIFFPIVLLKKQPHGYIKIISYILLLVSLGYILFTIFTYIKTSAPDITDAGLPTPTVQIIKPTFLPDTCEFTSISETFSKYTDKEYMFSFQYPTGWICDAEGLPNGNKGESIYLQDPDSYNGYHTSYNGKKQNLNDFEIDAVPNISNIHDLIDPNDPNQPSTYTNTTIDGIPAIREFKTGIFYGENNSNYLYPELRIYTVHDNIGYTFEYRDYITESLTENFAPSPDILSTFKWVKNASSQK